MLSISNFLCWFSDNFLCDVCVRVFMLWRSWQSSIYLLKAHQQTTTIDFSFCYCILVFCIVSLFLVSQTDACAMVEFKGEEQKEKWQGNKANKMNTKPQSYDTCSLCGCGFKCKNEIRKRCKSINHCLHLTVSMVWITYSTNTNFPSLFAAPFSPLTILQCNDMNGKLFSSNTWTE